LAFRTGMRRGEILALMWEDVCIAERFLVVNNNLSHYNNKNDYLIETPKTLCANRKIGFCSKTATLFNVVEKKGKFVFTPDGTNPCSRQSLNMRKICEKADIQHKTFHDLRHSHAYIALKNADLGDVQKRLGHASIQTTIDIYGHWYQGKDEAILQAFEKI
jgi:Site-specific recombinase XerD